jgi:hypothetical protein
MRISLRFGVAVTITALLSLATSALAHSKPLGQFEDHADIGTPKNPGNATYDKAAKQYTVTASGYNIWYARDEMHFVWRRLKGDFIFRAHAEFIVPGEEQHRKVGLMARSSLDEGASYVGAQIHGKGPAVLQTRPASGGPTNKLVSTGMEGANIVQLERRGNTYLVSAGKDGEPLTQPQTIDLDLGDEIYIGLYLSAHNPEVISKAAFRDVRITRPNGVEVRKGH